jgi:AP-1 complex subunit gamma-1
VSHTPELQTYTASRLYSALKDDISQESLTLAAVWILGEFGDALLEGGLVDEETPTVVRPSSTFLWIHLNIRLEQITDANIVDLEESVLNSPYTNVLTRQLVLTSLTKLYARPVVSDAQRERIVGILAQYSTSPELEIQQRSVEYDSLFGQREIVVGVLEQMPAPEIKATVIGTGKSLEFLGSEPWEAHSDSCSERESCRGFDKSPGPRCNSPPPLYIDVGSLTVIFSQ